MNNLSLGQPVPLICQISDGSSDKFVQAIVKDSDGATVSGSPFTLTHVANGKYTNDSLSMPNKNHIKVQYIVYDDAGFSIPSDYDIVTESFVLNIPEIVGGMIEATVDVDDELSAIVGDC